MDLIKKMFNGKAPTSSGAIAKDRLQLVLMHDRVNLSPEQMDQLRLDLIRVLSGYVEVDQAGIDVALTNQGRQNLLVANAPITAVLQH